MAGSIRPVPMTSVTIRDDFWSPRQRLMTDVTIPYMEKILRDEVPGAAKSGAIRNFRMAAGEENGAFHGMVFQDSDVAKWLEAAAYSLAIKEDGALRDRVEDIIALIGRAQQEDGYLNTFFTMHPEIPRSCCALSTASSTALAPAASRASPGIRRSSSRSCAFTA